MQGDKPHENTDFQGICRGFFDSCSSFTICTIQSRHAIFTSFVALTELPPNLPKLLYIGFKLIPQIPYKIGV